MIYTITAVATGPDMFSKLPSGGGIKHQRVFGFFEKEHDVTIAIQENRGEMHEHLYDFLVVEECYPGIHAVASVKQWYLWNYEGRKWEPCEWPADVPPNTINFSMG